MEPTLRTHLARNVHSGVLCGLLVVASFVATSALLPSHLHNREVTETTALTSHVERLVERHGCWTARGPADMAGQVPGHVVVTRGGRAVYGGSRLVEQALAQTFDGVDHGLVVHAFCR